MHRLRTGLLVLLAFAPMLTVSMLVNETGGLTVTIIGFGLLAMLLWPFVADDLTRQR